MLPPNLSIDSNQVAKHFTLPSPSLHIHQHHQVRVLHAAHIIMDKTLLVSIMNLSNRIKTKTMNPLLFYNMLNSIALTSGILEGSILKNLI